MGSLTRSLLLAFMLTQWSVQIFAYFSHTCNIRLPSISVTDHVCHRHIGVHRTTSTNLFCSSLQASFNIERLSDSSNCGLLQAVPVYHINSQEDLHLTLDYILQSGTDIVGFDVEFDRNRFAFGFNLCLLQLYGNGCCYLIDPLAGLNLSRLYNEILSEPSICKVVHSPTEDLQLMQVNNCFVRNIFDIQESAYYISEEYMQSLSAPANSNYGTGVDLRPIRHKSLARLASELLGIDLEKDQQKSNWLQRPLTEEQLKYAAFDVLFLPDLKKRIMDLAASVYEPDGTPATSRIIAGNQAWEKKRFPPSGSAPTYKSYIREAKKSKLNFRSFLIWMKLLKIRENFAEKLNLPPHFIADKMILLAISQMKPETAFSSQTIYLRDKKGVHRVMKTAEVEQECRLCYTETYLFATEKLGLGDRYNDDDFVTYQKYIKGPLY